MYGTIYVSPILAACRISRFPFQITSPWLIAIRIVPTIELQITPRTTIDRLVAKRIQSRMSGCKSEGVRGGEASEFVCPPMGHDEALSGLLE